MCNSFYKSDKCCGVVNPARPGSLSLVLITTLFNPKPNLTRYPTCPSCTSNKWSTFGVSYGNKSRFLFVVSAMLSTTIQKSNGEVRLRGSAVGFHHRGYLTLSSTFFMSLQIYNCTSFFLLHSRSQSPISQCQIYKCFFYLLFWCVVISDS